MDPSQPDKDPSHTKHVEMLEGKLRNEADAHNVEDASPSQQQAHLSKLEKRVVLKQDLTVVLLLAGCYFFAYLVKPLSSPALLKIERTDSSPRTEEQLETRG